MVQERGRSGPAAERRIAKSFNARSSRYGATWDRDRHRPIMWTTDLSYDYVRINASYRS